MLLGPTDPVTGELADWLRSLNIVEHVSPSELTRVEISRDPRRGNPSEKALVALMRRWFFARKPDAGFVLSGFPATLLQAHLLDEWLEVRDEDLDAVISLPNADQPLIEHYRTLGLLVEETS